ncbi:MAG TPA: ribosome maturation factor RimM [Longimicrobiales bacterium]|nr:ribosome maturation factor RimM [Longimicrobiales bacterium]
MSSGASSQPERLVVGHVTKPHGTKGEVSVWLLTDRAEEVFAPGRELLVGDEEGDAGEDNEVLRVEASREFKRGLLVRFAGIDDRSAAERLAQRYLLVPLEEVAPLEEGEVFYHQLLGADVVTSGGEVIGQVREVYDTEPAHLLEVETDSGKLHLIPFTERIVRRVEPGRVEIEPPEGLLEL